MPTREVRNKANQFFIEELEKVESKLCAARARNFELAEALRAARTEIDRWGHGDIHYGLMQRDPAVLSSLAAIDKVLGKS